MMRIRSFFHFVSFVGPLLALMAASGCSSPDSRAVSGQLLKGGKPPDHDVMRGTFAEIRFIPFKNGKRPTAADAGMAQTGGQHVPPGMEVSKGSPGEDGTQSYNTTVKADGSFQFERGLPDGKYLVAVFYFKDMYAPPKKGSNQYRQFNPMKADLLKGQFNVANSPITIEVKGNTTGLTIDLDEYLKKTPKK